MPMMHVALLQGINVGKAKRGAMAAAAAAKITGAELDTIFADSHAAYLWCPNGILKSRAVHATANLLGNAAQLVAPPAV